MMRFKINIADLIYYVTVALVFIVVPLLIVVSVWYALAPETFYERYATAGGIFIVELTYFWMLLRYLSFNVQILKC